MRHIFLLLVAAAFAASVFPADAQTTRATASTEFQVTIDLTKTCNLVSASDISFGTLEPVASQPASTGTIRVTCSMGTPYSIGLGNGLHWDNTSRRMRHIAQEALIPYTLSGASAGGESWGDGEGQRQSGTGQGAGSPIEHTVHAQATLTGNEPPGRYEDTVLATLSF